MIFKIQRPLSGNDPWMAYTEGRRNMHLIRFALVPEELRDALRHYPNAYFEAEVVNGTLVVGERVEDQDW